MSSDHGRTRAMTRNLTTTLTGIVAFLSSTATTVLSILLLAYLTPRRQKVTSLAVVTVILQCIAICTTVLLIFSHLRAGSRFGLAATKRGRNCCFLLSCLVVDFVAAATTGVMLGWTYNELQYLQGLLLGQDPADFMLVIIVVYGLAELAMSLFFVCLFWVRRPATDYLPAPIEHVPEMSTAIRQISRPATTSTVQSHTSRQASLSRPPSTAPSDGRSSLRSSLSIITRPSSSRSKLIRQHSFTRFSRSSSFDNSTTARPSQDSGFDNWDTSAVSPHLRETVFHSSNMATKKPKGALEPIPGSRSPSPAKALEGPFFATALESSPPSSPQAQPSISRPPSRQRSPTSEDHIHPLFRTCSPTPPPTASSGTVVLAAPVAGQLVNERLLRRMRSGSLPSSPSLLVRSESYFDFATAPTSPAGEVGTPTIPDLILVASASEKANRAKLENRAASTREAVTPPVPEFILNAGEKRGMARRAVSVREGVGVV